MTTRRYGSFITDVNVPVYTYTYKFTTEPRFKLLLITCEPLQSKYTRHRDIFASAQTCVLEILI